MTRIVHILEETLSKPNQLTCCVPGRLEELE